MVVSSKWVIMKNRPEESEDKALQVYGDNFSVYDDISNLVVWLNKYNDGWNYWLKEIVVDE